jgi:hypothetical protein
MFEREEYTMADFDFVDFDAIDAATGDHTHNISDDVMAEFVVDTSPYAMFPGRKWFHEDSFLLTEEGDNEAYLTLSLDYSYKYVHLNVYSEEKNDYTHKTPIEGLTADQLDAFINQVEADYQVEIPSRFRTMPKLYIQHLDTSFAVHGSMDEDPPECELCGIEYSEVSGFFFPEFIPGEGDYLHLETRYGCYGGETFAGTVAEVQESVLGELRRLKKTMTDRDTKDETKEFIRKLTELVAQRSASTS